MVTRVLRKRRIGSLLEEVQGAVLLLWQQEQLWCENLFFCRISYAQYDVLPDFC